MKEQFRKQKYAVIDKIVCGNKVPHAILFEVDDCEKNFKDIKDIVKLILCKEKNAKLSNLNCGKCNVCSLIDNDSYPDLKIIETEGNWIKKQQLVDLKEDFNNKSLLENKKIYIIKEAEKLNVSSSNSLLKFLEEPEDDIIAILMTSNKYMLLDTILSRCQCFNLKNSDYILDIELKEKVEIFIDYIIRKKNLFVNYKYLQENVFIDKENTIRLLSEVDKFFLNYLNNDIDFKEFDNINRDKLNLIALDKIILLVKIIELWIQKLEYNINYKIWLDSFYAKIIGEVYG